MKSFKFIALFMYLLLRFPIEAQVQLGGHVYVPSSTDSTNGLTQVGFYGATSCNLLAPTSPCVVTNSAGGAPGPDSPYVGTISIIESAGVSYSTTVYIPFTPGRFYYINNGIGAGVNAQGWSVASSAPEGDSIQIPAKTGVLLWATINAAGNPSYEPVNLFSGITEIFNTNPSLDYSQANVALYLAPEDSQGVCVFSENILPYLGNNQSLTLTAANNCDLTFTQPATGTATVTLKIIQSSTSPYTGTISSSTVNWIGGSAPTIPATSGAVVFLSCYLDGTNTWCATNSGSTSIQTIAGNAPVNVVPVERFGAVADFSGPGGTPGTGTDNTTAIQACINYVQSTLGSGQCLLKQGNYRITSAIQITSSSVGIRGSSYGVVVLTAGFPVPANAPASVLYIDSATADAIDVNASGSASSTVANNQFNDFTIMRTQAPTTAGSGCGSGIGPAGLSIQFAGNTVVDRVWSEDSACNFYFNGVGSVGTGYISNSGSLWGYNGFNPAIIVYGFKINAATNNPSLRLRHTFSATNNISGIISYGYYMSGVHLEDIFLDGAETANQTYGRYWNFTGSAVFQSADLHDINGVNDTSFTSCDYVTGLTAATQGSLEISGGWCNSNTASSIGVDIESSSGVSVSNLFIIPNAASTVGIRAANSSHIGIHSVNIQNAQTAAIQLATDSDVTVGENVLFSNSGTPTTTYIAATAVTFSSFMGNSISGYGTTGISLDTTSNNNVGFDAVDTTNITSACSNAGTGNTITAPTCTTVATTYINTTFTEATSGALAGTTPATCTNGCVGPWVLGAGTDWTYTNPGISVTIGTPSYDYINSGQTNETLRWTITSATGPVHVFGRGATGFTNYFGVIMNPASGGTVIPQNIVSGSPVAACSTITGTIVGSYTLVLSGTSFTLTAPSGSCSGSITATTGTDVGLIADSGTIAMSAFSAKSF